MTQTPNWVTFTRRTDDPKLRYLEARLDAMGIAHRRSGESWHAPIMEVPEADHDRAWALLGEQVDMGDGTTKRLDDIDDDDALFADYADDA